VIGPKNTFGRHLLIICALMLALVAATSIIGKRYFQRISDQTRLYQEARACHFLFNAVAQADTKLTLRFDWGDTRNECAANDWKTAKDKFLAEVKKLAQNPALGAKDREIVDTIRNSWKGYEISFNRKILADGTINSKEVELQRNQIETALDGLGQRAYASLEYEIGTAERVLNLLLLIAEMTLVICLVLLARHWVGRRKLPEEASNDSVSGGLDKMEASEFTALKLQAAHLKESLHHLTTLISEFLSQKTTLIDDHVDDTSEQKSEMENHDLNRQS